MRFVLYDHAGKGIYLRQRLLAAGHVEAERPEEMDLLLLDCDWPWAHPRPALIEAAAEVGAKVALYPHGGRPTVFNYDGICEPDPRVHMRLEHGPGSVEMASLFGRTDLAQKPAGWLFSPTRRFEPVEKPERILFAPLHPNVEAAQRGARVDDPAPRVNQLVYRQLLDAGYEVTVSLVGPPRFSGIWPHPRARIVENPQMMFHHSFEQILSAQIVVAAGTVAAAAVALGKPTVMFGQDTFMDYIDGRYVEAAHADVFRVMCRYPIDASDGPISDMVDAACAAEAGEWRNRFVGDDGAERAVQLLEELASVETANVGG